MKRTLLVVLILLMLIANISFAATPVATQKLTLTKNQYFINGYRIVNTLLANPIVTGTDGKDYLPMTPENLKLFGLKMTKDKFLVELLMQDKDMTLKYVPTTQRVQLTTATRSTKALKLDGNLWNKTLLESKGIYLMPINSDIFNSFLVKCTREKGKVTLDFSNDELSPKVNADAVKKVAKPVKSAIGTTYNYNNLLMIVEYANGDKYIGDYLTGTKTGYGFNQYKSGYETGQMILDGQVYLLNGFGRYSKLNGSTWVGGWIKGESHGEVMFYGEDGRVFRQAYDNGRMTSNIQESGDNADFVLMDGMQAEGTKPLTSQEIGELSQYVCRITAYDKDDKELGQGSGVIIGYTGLILTNEHVVKNAAYFFIDFEDTAATDEGYYTYSLILQDADRDLALIGLWLERGSLAIKGNDLEAKGEEIYTIGSPLGYINTLSEGIVSSPSRIIDNQRFVQITAPISPGSSGGALLDAYGNLAGITTAMVKGGESMNLAIPVSTIRSFLETDEALMGTCLFLTFGMLDINGESYYTDYYYGDYEKQEFEFISINYDEKLLNALDAENLQRLADRLVKACEAYVDVFEVKQFDLIYHVPGKSIQLLLKDGNIVAGPWTDWKK